MHIAILGNGVTGVSAALRLRTLRPDWKITLISGESRYHYSRPALMYIFMGHMSYQETKPYPDDFWAEQRIELLRAWVTSIDLSGNRLELHEQNPLAYDKLLIATGSKSMKFGWPGQDLEGVQGLWDLRDLRLLSENCRGARRAVLVGGGLIGIELAEMLLSRGLRVTFLVREQSYWDNVLPAAESQLLNRIIRHEGIDLRLETNLKEIVDDGRGRACAVVTEETGERIECDVVGLTPGVGPNTDLVKETGIRTGRGILVDDCFRTSVANVLAAGDCAEIERPGEERNLIQQVWYTGKAQGRAAAEVLAGGERAYDPGLWYNSAKFFDLEYQTYGFVPHVPDPSQTHAVWEHPNHRHLLRLVVEEDRVVAVNLLGLRHRHRVWERWIGEQRSPEHVLSRLGQARFDPEFFAQHEAEIVTSLRRQLS